MKFSDDVKKLFSEKGTPISDETARELETFFMPRIEEAAERLAQKLREEFGEPK